MAVITLDKQLGYELTALTINADGTLLARYSVGAIDEAGGYKPLAEKNYMLSTADSTPILATPAVNGQPVYAQLAAALATALSQRSDWLA